MRSPKICLLIVFTLSMFMYGCEQETSSRATSDTRLIFEPNVHDKKVGEYIIHINALTTDQLPADVARSYDIVRSKNRIILNLSIRKQTMDGEIPMTATINANVRNLSNQLKDIQFKEIIETGTLAIYYIGEVSVANEETLIFDLDVTLPDTNEPILLSYRQRFFTE